MTIASLTTLIEGVTQGLLYFWGIFEDLVGTIANNSLLLFPVGLAIVSGTIALGFKLVRRFGLMGRRV